MTVFTGKILWDDILDMKKQLRIFLFEEGVLTSDFDRESEIKEYNFKIAAHLRSTLNAPFDAGYWVCSSLT